MGLLKIVVYRFVDDPRSDEVETDLSGALTLKKDDIIFKDGKYWKIKSTTLEDSINESQRPTLWVYLVDTLVN